MKWSTEHSCHLEVRVIMLCRAGRFGYWSFIIAVVCVVAVFLAYPAVLQHPVARCASVTQELLVLVFWQLSGCSLERSELSELQQNQCSGQSSLQLRSTLKQIKKNKKNKQGSWGLRRHPSKYCESHPHTLVLYLLSWMFDQLRIIVSICWLWVTQFTVNFERFLLLDQHLSL